MGKESNSYVEGVKDITIELLRDYINLWLKKKEGRTIEQFAHMSGLSVRTIKNIKNYEEGRKKPDPRLSTITAILLVLNSKPQCGPINDEDVIN